MSIRRTLTLLSAAAGVCLVACARPSDAGQIEKINTARLIGISKGANQKAGYYMPQRLMLSATKPAGVTREPAYSRTPQYGSLKFGPADGAVNLALDEAADATEARLYVDGNVNGDLTDDPVVEWQRRASKVKNREGAEVESVIFNGSALIHPKGAAASSVPCTLALYRFAPATAKMRGLPENTLLYYRDYGREGKITLGGKEYGVMVLDELAAGRYDRLAHGDMEPARVQLMIDRDGNGKYVRQERFDASKPFNIGGTTYEVESIAPDGSTLKLKASNKTVAEVPMPADLSMGKAALAFARPVIGGKTVNFPADYKGRLVMLDFWATWCGPCIAEIPGLVKAYEKYHARGFDVLGISLDQANKQADVEKFVTEKKMPWPQVYDGKYWGAEIAQMYAVDSIPRTYLVDGATGKIVASGNELRGEALDGTIAKALAAIGK